MISKKVSAIVLSALLLGCADSYSVNETSVYSNSKFEPQNTVYVAMSKNGEYGQHYYASSGKMVSQVIQGALLVKLHSIELASLKTIKRL